MADSRKTPRADRSHISVSRDFYDRIKAYSIENDVSVSVIVQAVIDHVVYDKPGSIELPKKSKKRAKKRVRLRAPRQPAHSLFVWRDAARHTVVKTDGTRLVIRKRLRFTRPATDRHIVYQGPCP